MDLSEKIKSQARIVEFLHKSIDGLLLEDDDDDEGHEWTKKEKQKARKDVIDVKQEVEALKKSIESKSLDNKYEKIEMDIDTKTTLKLPKYGAKDFERKLGDRMNFNVIGVNKDLGFMLLKIKGWPSEFKMKLTNKNMTIGDRQSGDASLIYDKGKDYSEGPKEKINFTIRKLYEK
jgi:hypothetical protein